jgi:hypothetical protein
MIATEPTSQTTANLPVRDVAKEWLLEEQKQRRLELDNLIHSMELDQRNGVLFTGIIWAWLFTNSDKITGFANIIVALLPTLITAFLFYRNSGLSEFIRLIAGYTRTVEHAIGLPDGIGWESHVHKLRETGQWPRTLGKRSRLLWAGLVVVNTGVGVVYLVR